MSGQQFAAQSRADEIKAQRAAEGTLGKPQPVAPVNLIAAFEAVTGRPFQPAPLRVITADEQRRIDQAEARAEDRARDLFVDEWQAQQWQNIAEAGLDLRAECR